MSFRDLARMDKAYRWQTDRQGEMMAHFTAILARPHSKKRNLSGKDLYRTSEQQEKVISLEERKKRFEEANKLMGPEAIPVKRVIE